MRRFILLAATVALLGSALASPAIAAKANGGNKTNPNGQNSSPHFITGATSLYGQLDANGDLLLKWKVAGLGYNGFAWITVSGKAYVTVTCKNLSTNVVKTSSEHQVPVHEQPVFSDEFGNAIGTSPLHPNALCKGQNSELIGVTVNWSGLDATLWPSSGKSGTPYDYELLSGTWDYNWPPA